MSNSYSSFPLAASAMANFMNGNTRNDFHSKNDPLLDGSSPFRFKDLPAELRMRVYALLVPQHLRIALDPMNVTDPGAFAGTKCRRKIIALLLVSKSVYAQVLPLIYGTNTFCLADPLASDNALSFIGHLALGSIQKLEIQVPNGLVDLGVIWDDLTLACDLKTLKLVFYHDEENWLSTLADLALMPHPKPTIDLQLYTSIWAIPEMSATNIRNEINEAFQVAERRRKVVRYTGLPKTKHVTVAASVTGVAPFAFLTYTRKWSTRVRGENRQGEQPAHMPAPEGLNPPDRKHHKQCQAHPGIVEVDIHRALGSEQGKLAQLDHCGRRIRVENPYVDV